MVLDNQIRGSLSGWLVVLWMLFLKYFRNLTMIQTPLPVLAAMFEMLGFQLLRMALLAELQIRTYHEAQNRPTYVTRRILRR